MILKLENLFDVESSKTLDNCRGYRQTAIFVAYIKLQGASSFFSSNVRDGVAIVLL